MSPQTTAPRRRSLPLSAIVVVACVVVLAGCTAPGHGGPSAAPSPGSAAPTPPAGHGQPVVGQAGPESGIFSVVCMYDHTNDDDPIVHPGMAGMSHQHDFFGNKATTSTSTGASLVAPGAGTTCSTSKDTAAYWVPSLTAAGAKVDPAFMKIYYQADRTQANSVQTLPTGLSMIVGDAMNATGAADPHIGFACTANGKAVNPATVPPEQCSRATDLIIKFVFPYCWDGHTLAARTAAKPTGNVVYGDPATYACPTDHPVRIPQLIARVHYTLPAAGGVQELSSGHLSSAHIDFLNGWDPAALSEAINRCVHGPKKCGKQADAGGDPRAKEHLPGETPPGATD